MNRAVDALAGAWASPDAGELVDLNDILEADWLANPDRHSMVLESELVERQYDEGQLQLL